MSIITKKRGESSEKRIVGHIRPGEGENDSLLNSFCQFLTSIIPYTGRNSFF
jgi:hypothetical protein